MARGGRRAAAALAACGTMLAACGDGGGGDPSVDGSPAVEASGAATVGDAALLRVIEAGVDVADEPVDTTTAAFRAAEDGEGLVVGDLVRTDASGFAQVDWFDGALARVDADTLYALTELDAVPGTAVVVTHLDVGRVWNRLRAEQVATYEVVTDVGVAGVRGTAFSVACDRAGCTFATFEGIVVVTLSDGSQVELAAGEQLTVGRDGTAGEVEPADSVDPWVVRNARLDRDVGFPPLAPVEDATLAGRDESCPFVGVPDGWMLEPADAATGGFCRLEAPDGVTATGLTAVEWRSSDLVAMRSLVEAQRDSYEQALADVASRPCGGADTTDVVYSYDDPVGGGSLVGISWSVASGEGSDPDCGHESLAGDFVLVVLDGQAFEVDTDDRFHLGPCPRPSPSAPSGGWSEHVECWHALLADRQEEYREVAAALLGG